MGIFDAFRKKEEPPPEEPMHSVPLAGLPEWTDGQFRRDMEVARKASSELQERMRVSFSDAMEAFLNAGNESLEGDDRMATMANMTKDSYVKHAVSTIQNLKLPEAVTYQELSKFRKTALSALKDMNTLSPKQAILLRKCFGKESSELAESLRKIDSVTEEMKQFLEIDGKVMEVVSSVHSNVDKIGSMLERSSILDSNEKETREEMDRLDHVKREVSRKLDLLLGSSEWGKLKSFHEMIEEGVGEAAGMESDANEVLRSADRPLKKLAHLSGAPGPVGNPFREFVLENRDEGLMSMLSEAEKAATEGRISLNSKESEKLSHVKDYLREETPMVKKRYMLLTESVRNARNRLSQSSLPAEKETMERKLEETETALRNKWSELDGMIQERKRISSEVRELKDATEKLLMDSGKKVEIVV